MNKWGQASQVRKLRDRFGLKRVVFVGDRPYDDVHGAKQVGMRAVLVPHSAIPENQKGHVEGDPDAVVQRLSDLLPVIDKLEILSDQDKVNVFHENPKRVFPRMGKV